MKHRGNLSHKLKEFAKHNYFPAILAFLISFSVYLVTLCPTVYWGDSGEFITSAYTLGISHPTGYPTYTVLGKLFTFIPFGTVAWRVNLMSAVFASLAVFLLYLVCFKLTKSKVASFSASLIFAFSSIFWGQAVIAEVYTLHIFFAALNILILLHWKETKNINWLYLFFFTFGLSLTNHITSILLFAPFIYFILADTQTSFLKPKLNKKLFTPKIAGVCLLALLVGLLPYTYIPVRSSMHPAWNWGEIGFNVDKFLGHITGQDYQNFITTSAIRDNLHTFISTAFLPFSIMLVNLLFICLIAYGFYLLLRHEQKRRELSVFSLLALIAVVEIIFALNYKIPDIAVYFIPVILIFGMFLAVAMAKILEYAKNSNKHHSMKHLAVFAVIALIMIPLFLNFRQNDLHADRSAEYYWLNIFESTQPGDIIIGMDTNDMYISMYIQNVNDKFKDRIVLNAVGFTKPWWVSQMNNTFQINTSQVISYRYGSVSKANEISGKVVDEIFESYSEKTNILTTYVPFNTTHNLVRYGHLFKLSAVKDEPTFPSIKHPYTTAHHPDSIELISSVLINYGADSLSKQEYYKAIDYFEQAVKIKEDSFEGWNNLAIAYYQTKQTETAINAWERALKIQEDPTIRNNLLILKQR